MTYPENPPYTGGPDEVVPTGGLSATGIAALAAISAQDWEDELYGAADTFLTPISELLGKLFDLFAEFVDLDGFIEIASDVLGFFYNLLDRAGFFDLLSGGVDLFGWLADLGVDAIEALIKPIVEVLKWAWELITGLIDVEGFQAFVERIVNALSPLFSATIFADLFTNVVKWFSDVFGGFGSQPDLLALIDKLPIISTIVGVITGKTNLDAVDLGLGTLGEWARKIERDSKSSFDAIEELGRRLLGGAFQAPPNGGADVNVLSQGDFATLDTIEAADGWSWDNTTTASGSGGSAKLVASGSAQRLYSKQSIPVVAGDVITMSGQVKTSGFTAGTGRSIALSVVPWNGSSRILDGGGNPTSVQFTPRTTAAANWVTLSGSYTIPAGVTSIQARLAVTANSGAQIWFDDISIKKKSEMGQDYVNNLIPAWRSIYQNATGTAADIFWDAVGAAIGGVKFIVDTTTGQVSFDRNILFGSPNGGTTVVVDNLPVEDIGDELGVALPTGSGAKMSNKNPNTKVAAGAGAQKFTNFYTVDSSSSDITPSAANGSFQVTHGGWYMVEVGFSTNSSSMIAGAFNVAPCIYVGGSNTPHKIGEDAWGSYLQIGDIGMFGNYARSSQSTFIVYLPDLGTVQAGYVNRATTAISGFFEGDTAGADCYFSIAMLNRTAEG